ncbi:PKD domain-containing protein [Streptomyces sp. NPDC058783]|uniref:PKD domain-containing protein n=1 Tax=Streptomyces TaxID=1883 RepID=UPI00210EF713|nr:PKD domain-containing protein [Streptomyces coelicoflavus]MCQ4202696.1 PKD domain-containing protein [Streptomyces coelicoflavus]
MDTGFTCTDDGTFTVTLTADDGVNRPVSDSAQVTVKNVAPAIRVTGPEDWSMHRVRDEVSVRATFTDPGFNDTHTCKVTWDDGQVSTFSATDGACAAGHRFNHAGMNTIKVEAADDDGSDNGQTMAVVHDPRAGLLTGLGTVDGSAFTVAGKYPSAGSTVPAGAVVLSVPTENGRLKVVSTKLEWLVITPDSKAAVKGESARHASSGTRRQASSGGWSGP